MFRRFQQVRLLEQNRGDGGEGGSGGESPSAVNARGNAARLARIAEIGDTADGQRSEHLQDVDGERVTGRFQNGELDESPAAVRAREAQERAEADDAEAERIEAEEAERARRLQAEDADDPGEDTRAPRGRTADEEEEQDADEKVVAGVRYYRTMVSGQEKWLTLAQLREGAGASATSAETLQRAEDALRSASHAALSPKPGEAEVSEEDLENIVLSAALGDVEAARKLVSVIKGRPAGASPQEISRQVSQQIATQREVDRAETAQADVLGNAILAPIFRQRIAEHAAAKPTDRIVDAYKAVGDSVRKDFAAMIKAPNERPPLSKQDRKRTIVSPPAGAGRQPPREDPDREVPVGEQIDAIARARGQGRAHRVRRS